MKLAETLAAQFKHHADDSNPLQAAAGRQVRADIAFVTRSLVVLLDFAGVHLAVLVEEDRRRGV